MVASQCTIPKLLKTVGVQRTVFGYLAAKYLILILIVVLYGWYFNFSGNECSTDSAKQLTLPCTVLY